MRSLLAVIAVMAMMTVMITVGLLVVAVAVGGCEVDEGGRKSFVAGLKYGILSVAVTDRLGTGVGHGCWALSALRRRRCHVKVEIVTVKLT